MSPTQPRSRWLSFALLGGGVLAFYAGALGGGFLNDDYLFLEEARGRGLGAALVHLDALANYYRPLSRAVWFAALTPVAGGHPLVFHLAGAAVFAAALALLFDLLASLLPASGALAGVLAFALLPLQRVNLTWISCSQDLLALLFSLAALALWRRGHGRWAAAACLGAMASKEAALPLPLAIVAWETWIERRPLRVALRRTAPLFGIALAWGAIALGVALSHPAGRAGLRFGAGRFAAALVHGLQSAIGLEDPRRLATLADPGGLLSALASPPRVLALLLMIGAGWLPPRAAGVSTAGEDAAAGVPPRRLAGFAVSWFAAFALVTGPVAAIWSAYFYTLAAIGAAIGAGFLLRRLGRWSWALLVVALVHGHIALSTDQAFAVREDPWGFTSHLTASYFERVARYTRRLSGELRAAEPSPPHGARFFLANLPPYAGFQMGNGALVRALYHDPTLASFFYSQFSESTAADRPCRFFYWTGGPLRPLYRNLADPFFQVGCDQMLFERWDGACWAFRRALAAGGSPADNLYFLGWAELWRGDRDAAESAWKAFGAADDSAAWAGSLAAAETHLGRRDTLAARRALARAVSAGIGRPQAHARLGELLLPRQLKYGILELGIATRLDPADGASRRRLLQALLEAHMDEPARRLLEQLVDQRPELASDPLVLRARERLGAAEPAGVIQPAGRGTVAGVR